MALSVTGSSLVALGGGDIAKKHYANILKPVYMLPGCARLPLPLVVQVGQQDGQDVFRLYGWAQFASTFELPFLDYIPAPDKDKPYPPSKTPDAERYKYCNYKVVKATRQNKG